MLRALVLPFAVAVYCASLFAFLALVAFLGGFGGVRAIDAGAGGDTVVAIAVDVGLLALFGASHSLMARPSFKARWTRVVPQAAERSVYVLVTAVAISAIVFGWREVPIAIYRVEQPALRLVLQSVSAAGVVLVLVSTFLTNHFELFGLRQAWLCARGRAYEPVPFVERWLYKRVRHPMMLGMLIWFWATPTLGVGRLVFDLGMTLYIAIGVSLEERDLARHHGEAYLAYKRRVPAILPRP